MKRLALILLILLAATGQARALEPERREVVVINGRVWEGFVYKENVIPSTVSEFRLMGGKDSALSFARTQEYYWPLSRQVYVDFEKQREELDGVLRIEQGGKLVSEIMRSQYSIIYPDGVVNGNASLIWGQDAASAYEAYKQSEKDFARQFVEAQRAHSVYERQLLEAGLARKNGEKPAVIPAPAPLPVPSLRLVTQPAPAFRIGLPAGVYQISLFADGRQIAGTGRDLRVMDVAGRQSIVADIVPEERWTRPLASNSKAARIFPRPGAVFYVTLAEAEQFDEAEYLPLVTP